MASFLDLFGVTDTDGVNAARYQINFASSGLKDLMSVDTQIFGMLAKGIYLVFQWIAILANALLGLVFSSDGWLSSLGEVYQKVFGPLYAVFPPWAIAALGIGVVAFSSVSSKIGTKGYGESLAKRMATALGMTALVVILAYNPFAMLARLFELANGFSGALATAVTGGKRDELLTVGQPMVNATLRNPTIAMNYGRDFSDKCQTLWSEAMRSGTAMSVDSGCFTRGDDVAGPGHLASGLGLLLLAVPMLYFCIIAAWRYLEHLLMAAVFLLGTTWAAAIGVFQRRGFDTVSKCFARSGAHLAVAVIVSMLTVALPAAFSGLGMSLFGALGDRDTRVFGQILGLGVGFAVSAWAIRRVTDSHGLLLTALQADTKTNLEILLGTNTKDSLSFKNTLKWENIGATRAAAATGGNKDDKALAADPTAATRGGQRRAAGVRDTADPAASTDGGAAPDAAAALAASADDVGAAPAATPGTTLVLLIAPVFPTTSAPSPAAGRVTGGDSGSQAAADSSAATPTGTSPTTEPPAGGAVLTPDVGTVGDSGSFPTPATGQPPGRGLLADGAALADPTRDADREEFSPVNGNVFADPDLDAAARDAGAVFVAGPAPTPKRVVRWGRRLMPGRFLQAPVDGLPEIRYAPPLIPAEPQGADPGVDAAEPPSRLRRVAGGLSRLLGRSPAAPVEALSEAGLQAGENVHPQSFLAAQGDALETSQLKAEIEEERNLRGAMGVEVQFDVDPRDERLGLNLSSDPEERVRPYDEIGFGEPV